MTRRLFLGAAALAALAALAAAGAIAAARAAGPSALWRIVHDQCAPDQRDHGAPAPCASVDLSDGVAILKDIHGVAQYLAIPTRRIAGIESPAALDPALPNYWAAAWAARGLLDARLGQRLPRDAVGLAINASSRRSQDQLHIHIDCVAPEVRDALAGWRATAGAAWRRLPFLLNGRRYWARRLDSPDLAGVAPFRLLAEGVAGAREAMAEETLVVIGASFAPETPGFVLLADRADASGGGHGEDLLDAACAVAGPPQ
jgi:CDP-diacylglycerol pyrophosphatase